MEQTLKQQSENREQRARAILEKGDLRSQKTLDALLQNQKKK